MYLPNLKRYVKAKSLEEALELLLTFGEKAKIIAGGTFIYQMAERGLLKDLEVLIDLEDLGLNYIKFQDDGIYIGALATYRDIINEEKLRRPETASIYKAAKSISTMQIKNVGTIGGAISISLPYLDLPIALCSLNAKLRIKSSRGERTVEIRDFYKDYLKPGMESDEILVEVIIPIRKRNKSLSNFAKFGRTKFDFALVNTSVNLVLDEEGRIEEATIAFGNIDRTPLIEEKVVKLMKGREFNEEVINEVAKEVPSIEPYESPQAPSWFKRKVCKVLIRDCLMEVFNSRGIK